MPPEVCQIQNGHYSRQGRASDIWALGLFFLLPSEKKSNQIFLFFS
jgi:serine/threonine protein kinase